MDIHGADARKSSKAKASWSPDEDETLLRFYNLYTQDAQPASLWVSISNHLPGRKPKLCRDRYINHVDPSLNHGPWSASEDAILHDKRKRLGNCWAAIAKFLPGRSEEGIRNRWRKWERRGTSSGASAQIDSISPSDDDEGVEEELGSYTAVPSVSSRGRQRRVVASASSSKSSSASGRPHRESAARSSSSNLTSLPSSSSSPRSPFMHDAAAANLSLDSSVHAGSSAYAGPSERGQQLSRRPSATRLGSKSPVVAEGDEAGERAETGQSGSKRRRLASRGSRASTDAEHYNGEEGDGSAAAGALDSPSLVAALLPSFGRPVENIYGRSYSADRTHTGTGSVTAVHSRRRARASSSSYAAAANAGVPTTLGDDDTAGGVPAAGGEGGYNTAASTAAAPHRFASFEEGSSPPAAADISASAAIPMQLSRALQQAQLQQYQQQKLQQQYQQQQLYKQQPQYQQQQQQEPAAEHLAGALPSTAYWSNLLSFREGGGTAIARPVASILSPSQQLQHTPPSTSAAAAAAAGAVDAASVQLASPPPVTASQQQLKQMRHAHLVMHQRGASAAVGGPFDSSSSSSNSGGGGGGGGGGFNSRMADAFGRLDHHQQQQQQRAPYTQQTHSGGGGHGISSASSSRSTHSDLTSHSLRGGSGGGGSAPVSVLTSTTFGSSLPSLCNSARSEQFEDYDHEGKLISNGHDMGIPLPPQPIDSGGVSGGVTRSHDLGVSGAARVPENIAQWQQFDSSVANRTAAQAQIQLHQAQAHLHSGIVQLPLGTAATVRRINHAHPFDVTAASARGDPPLSLPLHSMYAVDAVGRVASPPLTSLPPPPPPFARSASDRSSSSSEGDDVAKYAMQTQTQQQQTPQAMFSPHLLDLGSPTSCGGPLTSKQHSQYRASDGSTAAAVVDRSRSTGGGGIVSCGNNHDLQAVVGTPPAMLVQKLMHRPPAPALPQSPQSCTDETRGPVAVAAAATVAAPQHDPQQRSAPAAARVWHTQTPPPPQLRVRIPQMERRQRSLSDSDTPSAIRSNIALSGVVKNNTQQPDPGLYMCDLTTGYRGDEASRAAAARVIRSSPHSSPRAATAGDIEPEAAASYSAEEQRGDRLQQQQQQQSRSRGSIAHTSRPPPVPLLAIPKNGLLQPQALLAIPKEGLPQPQAQARVLDASSAQNQGQQSSSPPFPLQLLPLQLPKSGSIAAPATGGERRAAEVVSAAANILQTRLQLDEHQRNLRALKQQLQQQQQQQHPDTRAVVLGGIGDLTARVISMDEDRTPRALAATADATRAAARSTVHNNNNNSSGGGSGGATHAVASMTLGGSAEAAAAVAPSSEAHRHLENVASASAGSGDWSLPQPHQQLQQQLMMPSISSLTAAAATASNGAPVARSNFSQMVHLHDHPPSAAASVSQQHPGNDHHLAPYTNMTIFSPFSPEAPMGYEHTAAGAAAPRAPPPPPMMLHTLHLGTEEPRYLGGNGSSSSSSSSSALTHPMSATPRLLAGEDANKLFAMGSRIWDLALPATVLQQQQHAGHAQHDGSSSLSDIVSTKTIVSQNPWNNGTRPSISSQVYAQPPRQMVAHPADADGQASPALGQAELAPFIALSSSSSAAAANANATMHNDIDDHEGQFSHSMGEGTAVSWTDETQHHAVHVQAPPPTAVAQLNLGGLGNRSGASSGRSGADRGVSEGAHANKYHNSAGGPWSKQHTDTDVSEAEHLLLLSARDRCESVPAVDDTRTGTSTTLPPRLDDDDPFVRSCSRSSTPNGAAAPTAAAATRKTTHFSGTQALSLRTDTSSDAAAAATGLGVGGDGSSKWPPLVFHDMLRPGSSTGGGLSEPLPSHPPARIRSSSRINSRHSASSEALDSPSHMVVQPSRSAVATAAAVPAPRHPHYYGKGGGGGGVDVTEREWKCTPQSPTHRVSRGKSSSSSSSSSMFSSSSSSASRLPPSPTSSSVMNAAFHLHAAANSAYDASQQQQQQHVFQAQQPGALQQQAQLQQLHAMSHSDVPQQQQQQQLPSAATRAPAQSQYGLRERRVRRSYHDDDDCGDEEENEASATGAAEEKAGETYQYLREDGSDDPPSADDDEDDADFGEGSRSRKGRTQNKRAKRSHGSSAAAAATATGNLSVGSAASAADSTERDHSSSHPTGTSVSSSRRRATAGSNKTSARPPQQQQLVRATSSSSSSSSSANSGTARARWTAEEDDILYSLKTSGVQMTWPAIAAHLPGRSASRCQERWANHLDPSLKSEPWTPKEDEILSQKFAEMGPKWGEITEFLPGRSYLACKNRMRSAAMRTTS